MVQALPSASLLDSGVAEKQLVNHSATLSQDIVLNTDGEHRVVFRGENTHGTPYPYDTHVPLIVFGTGVRPGVREERVAPMSAAAILARALGVPPPEGAEYPVPAGLFQ